MLRKIFFPAVFAANLVANTQNMELLADDVSKDGDIVTATKNVVVYSQTYLVTADKAVYDQKKEIIELFGNVNMIKGVGEISRSNYAKLNLKSDSLTFESLFMMDKSMEVWLRSDESSSDSEYYRTKNAMVSSCNVADPDWSITASSAILNKESKFLHMFNPVFNIGPVPVFYLPYFGFSTDTTRRTGLLPPEFGYKRKDGVYFKQPIYFAPYNKWDLQIDPQIRTMRGAGAYSTFRFTDSPYSNGEISLGVFRDKESYRVRQAKETSNRQALKNQTHKGFGLKYDRNNIFKDYFSKNLQEILWLDATFLNDIDYLNLKGRDDDYESLVTSRLNYFLSSDDHYFGTYAKYAIDTEKIGKKNENKDTLELPTFQYHKFTDSFWLPNFLYSADIQSHRYDRRIGVEATQYELNLPLSIHLPILDDYFTLSFYENLYATHIDYDKKRTSQINSNEDKSVDYINNYHRFAIHSDLAKSYDDFYHTINYGAEYIVPGYKKGNLNDEYLYDIDGTGYENFLAQESKKDEASFYLTQYFYTSNGNKILSHSVSQGHYTKDNEYGNLKNVIAFYPFTNFMLYNKIEYSHIDNEIKNMRSGATYSNEHFMTSTWHTVKKRGNNKSSYLTSSASINLPHHYKLVGAIQYDLEKSYTKMWKAGFLHNRKCWNYSFVYQQDIEPTTTTTGSATKKTYGFYFMVNFYPMGGVRYDFSIESDPNNKR